MRGTEVLDKDCRDLEELVKEAKELQERQLGEEGILVWVWDLGVIEGRMRGQNLRFPIFS